MEILNSLIPKLEHFRILGYWIVLLFSMLESLVLVGVVVPGAVLVVFAGAMAAKGYFDLGDLIWFAVIGAVLGDGFSFMMGKRGTGVFNDTNRFLKLSYLEAGQQFFLKHGAKSVFLGRFVGLVRAVIPFVAGLSGMDARRFYFWNVLSAVAWAVSHLLIGYFLGQAWQLVEVWSSRVGIFLAAFVLVLFCMNLLKRFIAHQGAQLFIFFRSFLLSITQAVITNPAVKRLVAGNPRFFSFIANRLNRSRFTGLPLTLLGMAFVYTLLLLGGIVEDILTLDPIVAVDTRLANLLHFYRNEFLVKGFLWITLLGTTKIVLSVALLSTLLFWIWKKREFILPFWVTICGSGIFSLFGKVAFHRQRPSGIAVFTETSFSFPSGHATVATALYGFLIYFLWRQTDSWRAKLNVFFTGSVFILAIGFSRLYLGVHFLSDVLGGYLLGLLWLNIGICMVEWHLFIKTKVQVRSFSMSALKMVSATLIIAELIFYIHTGLHYNPARTGNEISDTARPAGTDIAGSFARYKLPRYTESIVGEQQEPLNVIIVAKDTVLLSDVFKAAGWQPADPVTVGTVARTVKAIISNENYPTAPISPSFWNGNVNDLGFEKPTPKQTVRQRHNLRLWKTNLETVDDKHVYVGSVSMDAEIKWGLTHKIKPDLDSERDALLYDLLISSPAASLAKTRFVEPVSGYNFAGDPFFTNGYINTVVMD